MPNPHTQDDIEFWIVPLDDEGSEPYAEGLNFEEAGEALLEATMKGDGRDYVLKPVRVDD